MGDKDKDENKGRFANINSSKAGARTQKELPKGQHPIQLYSLATPNGQKITTLLEELGPSVVKYDAWLINIMEGDQFTSGFVQVNPNSKIPAMVDFDGPHGKPIRVFESGSILVYLAEKYKSDLLPSDPALRTETLNWLFFQVGAAPYFGQMGHFLKYAPEKIQYGIDRYTTETQRLLDVLDQRLANNAYLVGDQYTIADIAWFPWVRCVDVGYNASEHVGLQNYKHVNEWLKKILERPAVKKGLTINSRDGPRDYHSE